MPQARRAARQTLAAPEAAQRLIMPPSPRVRAACLQGVARSMPTGGALDRVAAKLGVPFFETPTGTAGR
jgi:phosphoglucomutase